MKGTLLILIICIVSLFNLNAQSFLVLNNGEKIDYRKYKIKGKDNAIEIKKPKPAIIKIDDVDYIVTSTGDIRFIRPVVDSDLFNIDYALMEKIIDGKISILIYSTATIFYSDPGGINTYSNSKTYQFIEKEGKFIQVFASGLMENKKKDNQNTFRRYFSDDEEILNRLNSNDFVANYNNMLDLIRDYNVHAYEKSPMSKETNLYDAILFRGFSNQSDKLVAEVEIEDQNFLLANMAYRRIKLLDANPMKICINNGKNEFCDLIVGSKYMIKYIEIILKKNGAIGFRTRNKDQYQIFRNELNYQSN